MNEEENELLAADLLRNAKQISREKIQEGLSTTAEGLKRQRRNLSHLCGVKWSTLETQIRANLTMLYGEISDIEDEWLEKLYWDSESMSNYMFENVDSASLSYFIVLSQMWGRALILCETWKGRRELDTT